MRPPREVAGLDRWRGAARSVDWRASAYDLRRAALTVTAILAFVYGAAATASAASGDPDPGVDLDGATILAVNPAGFAWRDGIRPGQHVVDIRDSTQPGGWQLTTSNGESTYVTRAAPAQEALQATLPFGVLGLGAALLALVFLQTNRRWVLPAASLGLLASSVPMLFEIGDLGASAIAMSAAVPSLWLAGRLRRFPWLALLAGAMVVVFLGAWWLARRSDPQAFAALEGARGLLALVAFAAVVLDRTVGPLRAAAAFDLRRPRVVDALGIALLVALAVVLVFVLQVSPVVVGGGLLLVTFVLPGLRRLPSDAVGASLAADIRERAAADAIEEERARVARELHDGPLQELAGIIRRLEVTDGAGAEAQQLRSLADELRAVTTDLRPPVLDDLGLGASLEFLAEQARTPELVVDVDLVDVSRDQPDRRAPAGVELAVFRIAQEALANAVHHAGARHIAIDGEIAESRVRIAIRDDGRGLPRDAASEAAARGRQGLASMRRRAQAIDADFTIDGSPAGTVVQLEWRR